MFTSEAAVPEIPGISIERSIGRGTASVVYRASRGMKTVAVKVSNQPTEELDHRAIRRFLREGCLLGSLDHPVLPSIYEVSQTADNVPFIVYEYIQGRTLAEAVDGDRFDEPQLISLGYYLADVLSLIHEHGLLHRDIHPDNVLLDSQAVPRLIDFGLAAGAKADRAQHPEGTIPYLSPEQGGMLDRLVDARSDLYSLGAILYFCATGQPPYTGDSRQDILQQHATAPIPDLSQSRPELSDALTGFIRQLLAKDPSDRPPSARHLAGEFKVLIDQLETTDFESPTTDLSPGETSSPTELVGRRAEFQQLLESWTRAQDENEPAFALIEGPTGTGKSHLADAVVTQARTEGAIGVSLSLQRDESHPFSALQRLFEPLFDHLEDFDATDLQEIRAAIDSALDGRLGLADKILPRLSELFADRPLHAPTTSDSVQSRLLYDALSVILARLASMSGGLVLVVDNAHWLDEATEQVIERLATVKTDASILLVATVDNQSDDLRHDCHRIASLLAPRLGCRIALEQLQIDEVEALIKTRLGGQSVDAGLIERVYSTSQGNAYAITSYLHAMLDTAALQPHWGHWRLDVEALDDVALPKNLTDLHDYHLAQLHDSTYQALSWVALFGTNPTTQQLLECTELDSAALDNAFEQATRVGLLRADADGGWSLTHRAVRDKLLADLSDQKRRRRHQLIAESLDADTEATEHLFELARHYARGQLDKNPSRAVDVNHRAGLLARDNYAFLQAITFLQQAVDICDTHGVGQRRQLDADLGFVAAHAGDSALAHRHLVRALEASEDRVDRARLRGALTKLLVADLSIDKAHDELRRAFAELGEVLPDNRAGDIITSLARWSRTEVASRFPSLGRWTYQSPDEHSRARTEALLELYDVGSRVAYYSFEDGLFAQIAVRQHDLATQLDAPEYMARTHMLLGFMAASAGAKGWYRTHRDQALECIQELPDRTCAAYVHFLDSMAIEINGDHRAGTRLMYETVIDNGQWLDAWSFSIGAQVLIQNFMLRGHFRQAVDLGERTIHELRLRHERHGTGDDTNHIFTPLLTQMLPPKAALGMTENVSEALERCSDYFAQTTKELYNHPVLYNCLLGYHVEGDIFEGDADDYIARFDALPMTSGEIPFYLRVFYVWKTWWHLRRAERARQTDNVPALLPFQESLEELQEMSTVPFLKAYVELFSASLARLQGRHDEIDAHLEAARDYGDTVGMPLIDFEIAVERARYHRRRGATDIASHYLSQARHLAHDYGWENRLQRLRVEFRDKASAHSPLTSQLTPSASVSYSSTHTSSTGTFELQALLRVHDVLQTVRSPEQTLQKVLDEIVSVLGGQRGVFFVTVDDDRRLQPIARTDRAPHFDAPWAQGVVDQTFATEKPLLITTAREGRRWDQAAFDDGLRSAICLPLDVQNTLKAIVYVDSGLAEGAFSTSDIQTLETLAQVLGLLHEANQARQLRRQLTEAGQQSETLLEHATRAVGIGLMILTPDLQPRSTSPIVYTLAQPWGSLSQWWTQLRPRCQWETSRHCTSCDETEYLGTTLADITAPDDQRHVYELTSTGHGHDLTEEPTDSVVLIQDVTERITAQEELEAVNDELVAARDDAMSASRAKSSFLANMSHELRTPLNAIIGYSEMLLEDADDRDPQTVQDLERIEVSGRHLLELVSDILNLSKIETGRLELSVERFELTGLIDDVRETARQLVEQNDNILSVDSPPEIELVNDPTKLRQILLNLIGNAAKFTEGGKITLGIDVEDPSSPPSEQHLILTVADTGIGMSDDQLKMLFTAFYQAKQGSLTKEGGTGLGLTISQRFCDLMDGDIDVESELGVGTTFTVRIPVEVDL